MTTPQVPEPMAAAPRDAGYWAPTVEHLEIDPARAAEGFNVAGRRATGPQQGFGRLWQRTYSTRLGPAVPPERLIEEWTGSFGSFWPKGNRFGGTVVAPGEVAPIAIKAGAGLKLATGVLVLYADPESFTFMTPEGHMFAGWITFSGRAEKDTTVAQVQILMRTSDPLFEIVWPVMKVMEDRFWQATMRNVAAHFGVTDAVVRTQLVLVDRKRIWRHWPNVWQNSAIRTALHLVTTPVRLVRSR
jgi:hypothetical protein